MEDMICNAYAFLEYDGDFYKYHDNDIEGRTLAQLEKDWGTIKEAYYTVSMYMDDSAIKQAQSLVMGEF